MADSKYILSQYCLNGNGYGSYGNNNMGTLGAQVLSSCGASYENIAWFQQAVYATNSETPRAAKKQTLVNLAFSLAMKLGSSLGASQKAKEKVEEGKSNVENLANNAKTQVQETQNEIESIVAQANENAKKIQEQLDAIKDKEEEKQAIQEDLNTQKQAIEDNQKILADESSSEEDKNSAKTAITNAASTISELSAKVAALTTNTQTLNDDTTDLQGDNENLNGQTGTLEVKIGEINTSVQQETTQIQQQISSEYNAYAAKDLALSAQHIAEAEAIQAGGAVGGIFSFGLTTAASEAEAAKLLAQAADEKEAAGEYTSGITTINNNCETQVYSPLAVGYASVTENVRTSYESIGNGDSAGYDFWDISNSIGSSMTDADLLSQVVDEITDAVSDDNAESDIDGNDDNQSYGAGQELNAQIRELDEIINVG